MFLYFDTICCENQCLTCDTFSLFQVAKSTQSASNKIAFRLYHHGSS